MPTSLLENALIVEVASGSQILIQENMKDFVFEIEGKKFSVNL